MILFLLRISQAEKRRLFMRIYILGLILFSAFMQVSATTLAQKISINKQNVSIQEVLKTLKEKTNYAFIHNSNQLAEYKVNIKVKDASLAEVLNECFDGLPFEYDILDKNVMIKYKKDISKVVPSLPVATQIVQEIQVSGQVTDGNGNNLAGVSIRVKGSNQGTSTNGGGRYVVSVKDRNSVLVFSFVGFQSQEVPVGSSNTINVVLKEDAGDLEEVVVVGYGTQKKINLTGSVDVVSGDVLADRPAATVADLLKGASPNMNITMNLRGGEPGAVSSWNIRGIGSINGGSAPLILVDGVEMDVNSIDPESVESISILKDASASAVYGSRAPFGVVLITTKRGKGKEGVQIQYSDNLSLSSPMKVPSFIDSYTWATAYNQANANAGLTPVYSNEQMQRIKGYIDGTFLYEYDPDNPIDNVFAGRRNGNANNDWPRLLLKDNSFSQKHNINVSGGNEKTQYYLSGGFSDQNGVYKYGYDYYKRYNFLTNFSSQVTNWLKFNSSLKYSDSKTDFPLGETTVGREHSFREMIMFAPMMPFYNINGTVQSPLVRLLESSGRDKTKYNDFLISLGGELEPIKGWKTIVAYNYNMKGTRSAVNPRPVMVELGNGKFGNIGKPAATYTSSYSQNAYKLFNALTSYEATFNDHYFNAMVGFEQEENLYTALSATATDLIVENVPSIRTSLGETTVSDNLSHWATRGAFGRLNYNFQEKYLFEFSARYNGSSRFPKNKRFGFFPSASVGYNISKEDFWTDIRPYVNNFKLRGSYGSLGNQNVANYLYFSRINVYPELNWILDGERPPYSTVPSIISDNITWETITTLNLGVDANFLNNRLGLTFDWYDRKTSNMLGPSIILPYLLGATTPLTNNAELSTKGFELVLNWNDMISNDFTYHAKLSIGDSKSKILKFKNDNGLIDTWYDGKMHGEIWGFKTDGLIQTQGEKMADQSKYWSSWGPGDMKYVDVSGDGFINDGTRTLDDHGDLVVLGNSSPRYNIGIMAGFKWKAIDFNMFWQGVGKRDYYPHAGTPLFWGMTSAWANSGLYRNTRNLDYWRPADEANILGPNTNAYLPKPYFTAETNKNRQIQSRYLLDASYLRLKNLQIGYNFSPKYLDKLFLQNARIYVSGENLLTFSKLPEVFDPETVFASDPGFGGYLTSGVIYPTSRTISLGVNITFK